MATEILMPALSPTMEEGTLAKWLKSEGDRVEPGDLLAEIETDKATMEFEAIEEGVLGRILVAEGTEGVKVNTPIAVILEEGEDASALPAKPSGNGQAAPEPQQAEAAEPAPEPAAPAPETESGAAAAATPAPAAPRAEDGSRIFASPLARRIATERGIDLRQVKGSGPHGRIVKADVEKAEPPAAEAPAEAPAAPAAERPAPPAGPDFDAVAKIYADRETEEVRLDGMRRTIAARLAEAKQTIPHFYLRRDIRLDALLDLRKRMNARAEARGVKLSVNDYIIKACALALQEVPEANAVWAGDRILKLRPSDVAVAVAVEGGLFTPVIRDAHAKTLSTISEEMRDLAERARARKLSPQEYQGGAFAISNLGMYGIDSFDAVINPPHGSILAVGAGVQRPVAEEGRVALATVMTVTLSVDHRVIDGALGARFLDAVHGLIEDPMTMLI